MVIVLTESKVVQAVQWLLAAGGREGGGGSGRARRSWQRACWHVRVVVAEVRVDGAVEEVGVLAW